MTKGFSKPYTASNRLLLICALDLCISNKLKLEHQLWNCSLRGKKWFGTYPVDGAEVDSFSKVEALVEAAVISSGKGDHKLPSTLVGPVHLGGQTGQGQLTPKHTRLQGEHGFPTCSEDF